MILLVVAIHSEFDELFHFCGSFYCGLLEYGRCKNEMKSNRLSIQTKYICLKELDKGCKRKDLAKKYGVKVNTISDWVKNKKKHF